MSQPRLKTFLSIQAQDFIEETTRMTMTARSNRFLSIQAQDFIEDSNTEVREYSTSYS